MPVLFLFVLPAAIASEFTGYPMTWVGSLCFSTLCWGALALLIF